MVTSEKLFEPLQKRTIKLLNHKKAKTMSESDILGIQKHVLQLENYMLASDKAYELIQNLNINDTAEKFSFSSYGMFLMYKCGRRISSFRTPFLAWVRLAVGCDASFPNVTPKSLNRELAEADGTRKLARLSLLVVFALSPLSATPMRSTA